MKYRKLRIAWSVVFGILCLLLVAWWVRGYWWHDGGFVKAPPAYHVQFAVTTGALAFLPWCPQRFSIRGLLIATTAIAMIAGTIAFVDRNF